MKARGNKRYGFAYLAKDSHKNWAALNNTAVDITNNKSETRNDGSWKSDKVATWSLEQEANAQGFYFLSCSFSFLSSGVELEGVEEVDVVVEAEVADFNEE